LWREGFMVRIASQAALETDADFGDRIGWRGMYGEQFVATRCYAVLLHSRHA
jgi:hypothetical protein